MFLPPDGTRRDDVHGLSRAASIISITAVVISCVAAVMVVPEFRCALGLPSEHPCGPAPRPTASLSQPVGRSPSSGVNSLLTSDVDSRVAAIDALSEQIEEDIAAGRYDSATKVFLPAGSVDAEDSAYATIYRNGDRVVKVRTQHLNPGQVRVMWHAYYQGSELVYMYHYNTIRGSFDFADYFYFANRDLVRWLDSDHKPVPLDQRSMGHGEAIQWRGEQLLSGARSSDAAISW